MSVVIEDFRPMVRNTLRGFCRVRFESGLILDEVSIHVGSDDGRAWCSPPARPMVDKDGIALRDSKTQKLRYQGLITFSTKQVRENWSEQILRALRSKYPDAIPEPNDDGEGDL